MAKHHIEARAGEVFVGNHSYESGEPVRVPDYLSSLKTVRLGNQAYDIEGNKLSREQFRPLFIDKSEFDAHHRLMMKLTFPGQKVW